MAKGELPGSMDLLLDTMCNTFGGVMFIAISMALTISLCQSRIDPEAQAEQAKETLEQLREENRQLAEMRKNLDRRVENLQKKSTPGESVSNALADQVAKLEMQMKHIMRRIKELEKKKKTIAGEITRQEQDNRRKKAKAEALGKDYKKRLEELKKLYAELQKQLEKMKKTLEQTSAHSIHFARSKRTESNPYIVIIANERLYRLGTNAQRSGREVSVRREGKTLVLTPLQGEALSLLERRSPGAILPDFNHRRHFVWIIVNPDSFTSFVSFRRLMRKFNYNVHWYTATEYVLQLVENAEYSAAE